MFVLLQIRAIVSRQIETESDVCLAAFPVVRTSGSGQRRIRFAELFAPNGSSELVERRIRLERFAPLFRSANWTELETLTSTRIICRDDGFRIVGTATATRRARDLLRLWMLTWSLNVIATEKADPAPSPKQPRSIHFVKFALKKISLVRYKMET